MVSRFRITGSVAATLISTMQGSNLDCDVLQNAVLAPLWDSTLMHVFEHESSITDINHSEEWPAGE